MRTDKNSEPDPQYIKEKLEEIMRANEGYQIYITQGFICRNAYGEIDNLLRGGSDYTASLIGAALSAEEIVIWTDIDGMHNNDPRIVEKTEAVRQLNFEEAAELAYFGAKILHPTCVQPAKYTGIPVRLKNTMAPDAEGTIINNVLVRGKIKAVAAKDNITAIKIKSSRMLLATPEIRRRHALFFATLGMLAEPGLHGAEEVAWHVRLTAEHDNLRAALSWGAQHDAELLLRLAGALWRFWWAHLTEGRAWRERALAVGGEAPAPLRVKALGS